MHQLIRTIAIAFLLLAPASANLRAQTAPTGNRESAAQLRTATDGTAAQEQRIAQQQREGQNRRDQEASGSGFGASLIRGIGLSGLGYIVLVINYIIGMVGSTLFNLAGLLVEIGLYLNTIILNSEVVQLGWRIARDMANLGFTIGIVVIAYATMLGDESYGMKKTLLNFIIAAVMVNFSFSIAGFLIDASNLVTHFFVAKSIGTAGGGAQGEAHQFAVALANAFGPQRLLAINQTNDSVFTGIIGDGGATIALVVSVFFVALFTIFAALGMLAVGLTTFQRFVILSGLIITMPVMILLSSFPKTNKYWEKWKSQFIGQLLYLPVATFTIYLTLMFVTVKARAGLAADSVSVSGLADAFSAIQTQSFDGILPVMARPFQVIIDMAITLGLLTTGIIQSSKMSGAGGKIAIDMVKSVQDWAIGAVKSLPGNAARKTLTTTFGGKKENSLGNLISSGIARVPLVRRLGPGLQQFLSTTDKSIKGFEGDYNLLSNDEILANARSAEIRLNPERMAAMAKVIASKGLFHASDSSKGLTDDEFARFIPAANRFGLDKEVLKTSPHLYEKFGKTEADLAKFMTKDFKPDDMDKINSESLKSAAVVRNLTNAHMKKLEGSGKKDHRANMIQTLREMHTEDTRPGSDSTNINDFMAKNFSQPKNISDIHPDFLNEPFFVERLKPMHFTQMEKDTDFEQGTAVLATLNAAYEDAHGDEERLKNLDTLTKGVVTIGEKSMLWAPISEDAATKDAFEELRAEYLKRNELKGFGRTIDTPPEEIPTIEEAADALLGAQELTKQEQAKNAEIAKAADALMKAKKIAGEDGSGGTAPGPWVPRQPAPAPKPPQGSAIPGTSPRVAPPPTPRTSPRVAPPAPPSPGAQAAPATPPPRQQIPDPSTQPIDPTTGARVPVIAPDGFDAWLTNGGFAGQAQAQADRLAKIRATPPPTPSTTQRIDPPEAPVTRAPAPAPEVTIEARTPAASPAIETPITSIPVPPPPAPLARETRQNPLDNP